MSELKPCPFCGVDDVSLGEGSGGNDGTVFVECERCGITGPWKHTKAEAIDAWNQRTTEPKPEVETIVGYENGGMTLRVRPTDDGPGEVVAKMVEQLIEIDEAWFYETIKDARGDHTELGPCSTDMGLATVLWTSFWDWLGVKPLDLIDRHPQSEGTQERDDG